MLAASKHTECVFASSLRASGASSLDGWGCGNCGSGILTPTGATKADMWAEAQSTFFTECATHSLRSHSARASCAVRTESHVLVVIGAQLPCTASALVHTSMTPSTTCVGVWVRWRALFDRAVSCTLHPTRCL